MNERQASHTRAMADKIRANTQHMSMRMKNLMEADGGDYENVTAEQVKKVFNDLKSDWQHIESILTDMLGRLEEEEDA